MIKKIHLTFKFFKKGYTLEDARLLAMIAVNGFQARMVRR